MAPVPFNLVGSVRDFFALCMLFLNLLRKWLFSPAHLNPPIIKIKSKQLPKRSCRIFGCVVL